MIIQLHLVSFYAVHRYSKCYSKISKEPIIHKDSFTRNSRKCINFSYNEVVIGTEAFANWTLLEQANLISVTKIRDFAFANCSNLHTVNIGKLITYIGESAFFNCIKLTSLNIRKRPHIVLKSAFYNCFGIKEFSFSNQAKAIHESTFMNCISLKFVYIGKQVVTIDKNAFYNCKSLICILFNGKFEPKIHDTSFIGVEANAVMTTNSYQNEMFWKLTATQGLVLKECFNYIPLEMMKKRIISPSSSIQPTDSSILKKYNDLKPHENIENNSSIEVYLLLDKNEVVKTKNNYKALIGISCCIPIVVISIISLVRCLHPCQRRFISFETDFGNGLESKENTDEKSNVLILQEKESISETKV